METVTDRYSWAHRYADGLDALGKQRETMRGELCALDHCELLTRWGAAIELRGVLRKGDGLRIELRYSSASFMPTSNGGAYCYGRYYVIVHRNNETSRATLMVRASVNGDLTYYVDDDGTERAASAYITETSLPDGARKLINQLINDEWVKLGASIVDIWRECLAAEIRRVLFDDKAYAARDLVRLYGGR